MALRAVVAAASGDDDTLDRSLADEAWLGFTSIDTVLELEESFFAVGINIVRNRRAAEGDCFLQDFFEF